MKRFLTLGIAAALAIGAFAAAEDAVTIAWKPKAGNVYHYHFKADVPNVMGQEMKIEANLAHQIKEINADGNVIVVDKQDGFSILLGGNDMSSMGPKTVTETLTVKPNGEVIEKKSDQEGSTPRMDAMEEFIYPNHALNAGESWTRSLKADTAKGTYDAELKLTYQGMETVDGVSAYKVAEDYKETNAPTNVTAVGTIWVSAEDGELVKADLSVKNAVFGAQMPQTDANLKIDRVQS